MKITEVRVSAFGAWQDLDLHALSDGTTVFYGLNETGKTTLMNFARSMLYGFDAARQKRYVPPAKGGKASGSIRVEAEQGGFQIRRTSGAAATLGAASDELAIFSAEGATIAPQTLQTLLGGVDEAIFNNVFAVGLHEIQQLGTLDDTDAARLLYDLSAGFDRVSLFDVLRELAAARRRMLAEDDQPCEISRLTARREKLQAEIETLSGDGERLAQLLADREQLQQSIAKREEESRRVAQQARLYEAGLSVAPRWRRRAELDGQIAALGAVRPIDEKGLPLLERLAAGLTKRQQRHAELAQTYQNLRDQAAGVGLNRPLWRQAARIEAIAEQLPWLANIEQELHKLDAEAGVLERQVATEQAQLGLTDAAAADRLRLLSSGSLETLKAARRNLHEARRTVERLSRTAKEVDHDATSAAAELAEALSRRGIRDLHAAIDKTGDTIAKLRRRIQLEERLGQLKRTTTELEGQRQEWMHRQALPPWPLLATGAVFVLGFVLLLLGFLFFPQAKAAGMWLGFLGLAGLGIASGTKWFLESQSRQALDACQDQLELAQQQTKQATEEAAQIDRQLSGGGGPWATRLQAAERELGELEDLLSIDAKAKSRGQGAASQSQRLTQAQTEVARARKRWREALAACGLPEGYTLKQVRHLLARRGDVADLRGRLTQHRQLLEQRRGQYAALVQRTRALAKDAGLNAQDEPPGEVVGKLLAALKNQQALFEKRRDLLAQARKTRRRAAKIARQICRLRRMRREILDPVGAVDDADYRRLHHAHRQLVELSHHREQVQAEIAAALAGKCTEQQIAGLCAEMPLEQLEPSFAELRAKLQSAEDQLKRLYQERGELNALVRGLAADRRLAVAQLELAAVEEQLSAALDQWRALAVANLALDTIRRDYEAHRQPEALQEASKYLVRLTLGRYRRVWVPLGEHALKVDDSEGQSLAVELLSSGTREQLFLSLRLAMASAYAKKGVVLPLILDDVLVNFDGERATAAARVLCDFASTGHQVLLFTCHEHIEQVFRRLGADVRRLGETHQSPAAEAVVVAPPPMPEKPRKKRRAAPVLPPPPRPRQRPLSVETTSVFPVRHDGPEKPRPVFARWTTPAWDPAIEVPIEDEDRVVPPLDELAADTAEEVPWWYEYQSSEGESEAA